MKFEITRYAADNDIGLVLHHAKILDSKRKINQPINFVAEGVEKPLRDLCIEDLAPVEIVVV